MKTRLIKSADDQRMAEIIRTNLKAYKLDIPGTAYFDSNLDQLSTYYLADQAHQAYYVLTDDEDRVMGGVGFAKAEPFDDCAELQKLYLDDMVKGQGLGYDLVALVEGAAKKLGYSHMYLETHSNLAPVIHIYEKMGYRLIERPESVVHGGMDCFYIKDL
ncbi:MAG: GNAT family N-acetyltransferase [Pseudobutyrivibrio sp.]|nr:GNAT family N-acetyltransferase [Pseudobutyrivibrio sp.]